MIFSTSTAFELRVVPLPVVEGAAYSEEQLLRDNSARQWQRLRHDRLAALQELQAGRSHQPAVVAVTAVQVTAVQVIAATVTAGSKIAANGSVEQRPAGNKKKKLPGRPQ